MTDPSNADVEYYDHVDGVLLDPMPYNDGEAMIALLKKRMTPEAYLEFAEAVFAHKDKFLGHK